MQPLRTIAYFSMEVGLEAGMPTYSGGLGILAGDTIRAAADLTVPMVAVTLLYRQGYFYQRLAATGEQSEEPVEWAVDDFLHEQPQRVSVKVEGRTVSLRCWNYGVTGVNGFTVPVYFLDTDLPENTEEDRTLTHILYGGDQRYRLCQEVVLGIGGVRMLRALGYDGIERFHMNEGHASLLTLELLDEKARAAHRTTLTHDDIEAVRRQCLFTTHTLVPAGHDQFPLDLVDRVLGRRELFVDKQDVFCCEGVLNMTYLALNLSHYINGVAKKHGEESSLMFAGYVIDSITNGVHAATWVAEPFQELYDRYIPKWRQDNFDLRYALGIPKTAVWRAHLEAKRRLIQYVNRETNVGMDVDVLTLGFARRATTYKRADLLFADPERLKGIAATAGGVQVIYGGKAHPRDYGGKELIKRIFQAKEILKRDVKIVYLENYDIDLAKRMSAGVDVWLNTPQPPLEASGTSGMKAALNGVPSFSVLDGWWIEGCIEGITGWAIDEDGRGPAPGGERSRVVSSLYDKLERIIAPLFYGHRAQFLDVMLHAIALNGSFFNTHRMVLQYVLKAYQ
jgi:starch phosphorylase